MTDLRNQAENDSGYAKAEVGRQRRPPGGFVDKEWYDHHHCHVSDVTYKKLVRPNSTVHIVSVNGTVQRSFDGEPPRKKPTES
jgi:hypothetical protein